MGKQTPFEYIFHSQYFNYEVWFFLDEIREFDPENIDSHLLFISLSFI